MFSRIKTFLGINKGLTGLLITVVLVGMGEKMAERFLPLYLTALGASLLIPGLLNGLDVFLSAVYSIPGGWCTAKYGYKKSLLWFNLHSHGRLYNCHFYSPLDCGGGWVIFLSLMVKPFIAFCNGSYPVRSPQNKQVMGVSLHSLVRRIPMAAGPMIGGILIDIYGIKEGIRISFVLALVLGVISTIIQQYSLKKDDRPGKQNTGFCFPLQVSFSIKMVINQRYIGAIL